MTDSSRIPAVNKKAPPNEEIALLDPAERIRVRGYRSYIGGGTPERWHLIGKLQYHYLIAQGLEPSHQFLDVGCGSLRLGQFLIPYMQAGRYYGLEPEELLVTCGLERELLFDIAKLKTPRFAFNYEFDTPGLDRFDFAMANSIFTHMTPEDIGTCFRALAPKAHSGTRFFLTFFEGDSAKNKWSESHANRTWVYSFEEMQATTDLWDLRYIGDWAHPADQKLIEATLRAV